MLQPLYPAQVESRPKYQLGQVVYHSGGIMYTCWICGTNAWSLVYCGRGDFRCTECIPDSMKSESQRSHHGNRVVNAIRDCAPAMALWLAVTTDNGLQEVPRLALSALRQLPIA